MTKFIKTQDNLLRVRIKYDKTFKHYNLRLQKKFFCFWLNTDLFVDISERDDVDNCRFSPIILSYMYGGQKEIYNYGEMNFKERAKKLCYDYLKEQSEQVHNKKVLADL
tara:strand:- start:717 stop:1043 length:327 start_codon:yes stop_codon:yes gene_type:complete